MELPLLRALPWPNMDCRYSIYTNVHTGLMVNSSCSLDDPKREGDRRVGAARGSRDTRTKYFDYVRISAREFQGRANVQKGKGLEYQALSGPYALINCLGIRSALWRPGQIHV